MLKNQQKAFTPTPQRAPTPKSLVWGRALRSAPIFKCARLVWGFTLIEMLVVMFIVMLLSGLILANYRSSEKRYALNQASQRLISDLRQVQNMAISGTGIVGQYYGYGIYAKLPDDNTSYKIYGDENDNSTYQSTDATIETIYLPNKIKIQSLSPLPNKVDIFFKPPDPTTYINGDSSSGVSATIILQIEDTSLTKTVTVTTAGLIKGQ